MASHPLEPTVHRPGYPTQLSQPTKRAMLSLFYCIFVSGVEFRICIVLTIHHLLISDHRWGGEVDFAAIVRCPLYGLTAAVQLSS